MFLLFRQSKDDYKTFQLIPNEDIEVHAPPPRPTPSSRFRVVKTPIRPILKVSSTEPRSSSGSQTDIVAVNSQSASSKKIFSQLFWMCPIRLSLFLFSLHSVHQVFSNGRGQNQQPLACQSSDLTTKPGSLHIFSHFAESLKNIIQTTRISNWINDDSAQKN